ncbi:alanine/glycine:cation symporter family protein [Pseudoalteromonas fenneropenaei]|uniref:Alanine/glycine:cation symporter family protein n=1 Tax=Pseudoalteromonas fenneropenaei TaxID=1737459 RepID=A0ABV7CFT0_9GAMM
MELVQFINQILWGQGQLLIFLLIAAGLWFTWQFRAIQFSGFAHMLALLKVSVKSDKSEISSFQALCTGLSARVGTGNLAGVAVAVSLGGPGAVFWMWVIALLGMATGFAESVLGQVYKVRDSNGEFRGGPAYYIRLGLNKPWLAALFSVCLFLGYGSSFSAMQANTISDAMSHAFAIPPMYTGIVVTLVAGSIILGGMRRIARFAEMIVPVMGIVFISTAIVITVINFSMLADVFTAIVRSAFGLEEAGAGAFAAAIKNGVQRGLYSNEAGAGSVPHAAACATPNPNHPVTQGYLQMFGVFFDTIVLCSCTAMIILLAGNGDSGEMEGIRLTQNAMSAHLGEFGVAYVALILFLFAFSSVVANYAYAESNLHFFHLDNRVGRSIYTMLYLVMVLWGANATLKDVWDLADMALGLMTLVNIYAIVLLTPTIKAALQDYRIQRSTGKSPSFVNTNVAVQGRLAQHVWHTAGSDTAQVKLTDTLK